MSETAPCGVCGSTDLNLVDGYYYCVECGTQDVNIRETVIEYSAVVDGTRIFTGARKFTTAIKDGIEMSGEWQKWHAYNFILSGMVDELIALGAKPSVKMKVLWIWTRYIKKFQIKEALGLSSLHNDDENTKPNKGDDASEDSDDEDIEGMERDQSNNIPTQDIKTVSKSLLLAIIYVALNLDGSDIQLSHLLRFIREGRLSVLNCLKFLPKELDIKKIPQWKSFTSQTRVCGGRFLLALSMTVFKQLDLGLPKVPDLRNIVANIVKELCLPNDFINITLSLMQTINCDYLNIDDDSKNHLVRMIDYECNAASFVLIALKMCFGLDGKYEYVISDVVEGINHNESRVKSHKLGFFSDPTNRLFSVREWLNFLLFRKTLVSKQYLPIAQRFNLDVDDYVFMEQLDPRNQRPAKLGDEVTLDILNKMQLNEEGRYIPKSEFIASLTPMTTYTEVILQYTQDPDLRMLLSEDYSQYSVKFVFDSSALGKEFEDVLRGVESGNKEINRAIKNSLVLTSTKRRMDMVYVRNCDNKNWLKTKPPTSKHVTIDKECTSDKENTSDKDSDKNSDHGYDSNAEQIIEKDTSNSDDNREEPRKLEFIDEENIEQNIFDDLFDDIIDEEDNKETEDSKDPTLVELEISNIPYNCDHDDKSFQQDTIADNVSEIPCSETITEHRYNPETFDRKGTIRELVLKACKTYKVPIPDEYRIKEPKKRKSAMVHDTAGHSEAKKQKTTTTRTAKGEAKADVDKLLSAYYTNMRNDILNQVSDQVKNAVAAFESLEQIRKENENAEEETNNFDQSYVNDNITPQIDSHSEVDNIDDNIEPSLVEEADLDNVANLIPKGDPKFDEEKYDVKQLFLKFKDEFDIEEILDVKDDPELEKIFRKEECGNNESNICEESNDGFTSEDELPISKFKLNFDRKRKKTALLPLLEKSKKEHKYWLRHYPATVYCRNCSIDPFDRELKTFFPPSFTLLILEVAEILESSANVIYKNVQTLEQYLYPLSASKTLLKS